MALWETHGFDKIKDLFINLEEKKSLGHAYLFTGQEMIGKRTFALELALKLNKMEGVFNDKDPDIFYISNADNESRSTIQIDDIRDMKKFASLKVYNGPYKYIIIDNAHEMTNEAGNSILKLLEEPAKGTLIFLISAFHKKMLPTIISRCERINFSPHKKVGLEEYFKKFNLTDEQISFMVNFSNGRIGLAKSLYEKDAFPEIKKTIGMLQKLVQGSIFEKFDVIEKVVNNRKVSDNGEDTAEVALLYWMLYLRSSLATNLGQDRGKIIRKMFEVYNYLKQPQLNHRLLFERAFIKY